MKPTVIVTREDAPLDSISTCFIKAGYEVVAFPLMKRRSLVSETTLMQSCEKIEEYDLVAFTSKNAIDFFFEYLIQQGLFQKVHQQYLEQRLHFAVVGDASRTKLAKYNIKADFVGTEGGRSLAKLIVSQMNVEKMRVLFPRLKDGRDELIKALNESGAVVNCVEIYTFEALQNLKEEWNFLKKKLKDNSVTKVVTIITSPKRAEIFASLLDPLEKENLEILSIGKTTSKECQKSGFIKIQTAKAPRAEDILSLIL